ncbi:hypothetical protein, partial [Raoultella ornithinolytica]|uniref:hypothetical protein n=1 Tax=Raoultella ornithinolytica TaxID=54291 RepID=UPI001CCB4495
SDKREYSVELIIDTALGNFPDKPMDLLQVIRPIPGTHPFGADVNVVQKRSGRFCPCWRPRLSDFQPRQPPAACPVIPC